MNEYYLFKNELIKTIGELKNKNTNIDDFLLYDNTIKKLETLSVNLTDDFYNLHSSELNNEIKKAKLLLK